MVRGGGEHINIRGRNGPKNAQITHIRNLIGEDDIIEETISPKDLINCLDGIVKMAQSEDGNGSLAQTPKQRQWKPRLPTTRSTP